MKIECDNCGDYINVSIWAAIRYKVACWIKSSHAGGLIVNEELKYRYINLLSRHEDNLARARDLGASYRDMAKSYERIAAVIEKLHSPAVKAKEDHLT